MSTSQSDIAFLFDVDNTLLDNDRVSTDLQAHLEREVGVGRAEHYWRLFEQLRTELGDAVFQPRKVDRSGLFESVGGKVFIYLHKEKELADVDQRCPAKHYVVVEDKLRLLAGIKNIWGTRVTTVFVRQGHYALDPKILAPHPAADISIEPRWTTAAKEGVGTAYEHERTDQPAIALWTPSRPNF